MKEKGGYKRGLRDQAYQRLASMLKLGHSKSGDRKKGETSKRIYSKETFKDYWKQIKYFIKYIHETHPEIKSLKECRPYVNEWLSKRSNLKDEDGKPYYSAWTIQLEAKALGKLFQIKTRDLDYFKPPQRKKEDIKRSRLECPKQKKYFSEEKNWKLVQFCKSTGVRREGLTSVKNDCLKTKQAIKDEIETLSTQVLNKDKENRLTALKEALLFKENYFIEVVEKGGKLRIAPILNDDQIIIDKINETANYAYIWPKVNKNCDVHGYRAVYARMLYKEYARNLDELPTFYYDKTGKHLSVYYMRGENKGTKYDRHALYLVSVALGHERINVVADSYM